MIMIQMKQEIFIHIYKNLDIQTQIILDIIDHAPTIEGEISDEDIIKFGDRYFELKANEAKARETHGNIGQIDGTSIVPC